MKKDFEYLNCSLELFCNNYKRTNHIVQKSNILSFVDIEIEKLGKIKGVICGMCLRLV